MYAPSIFGYTFSAAILTLLPATALTASERQVKGAPITISTLFTSFVKFFNSVNVATASLFKINSSFVPHHSIYNFDNNLYWQRMFQVYQKHSNLKYLHKQYSLSFL